MIGHDADLGGPDPGTALRAIMTASVSDIRMPADLPYRAVKRNRRRKTRNGLMGAAAAAGALATVIATAPGWASGHPASARPAASRHVHRLEAQTAAYVLDHVATSLKNSYRMISVDRGSGGLDHGSILYTDMATQQQRYVSGRRDSSGQPYLQSTTSISRGIWTEFDVDYADHVYSTLTASNIDQGQRVTVSSWLPLQTSAKPTVAFRQALKAHEITVVGHRILDGRDTILLRVNDMTAAKPEQRAPRAHGLERPACSRPATATAGPPCRPTAASGYVPSPQGPPSWIWVDASTYLVVQTEQFIHAYKGGSYIPPTPTSKLMWIATVDRVTWLPPTPPNLALLTLTPPARFTNVPYSVMVSYLGKIS